MAAGPKIWRKSPDPTQRSGWGSGHETTDSPDPSARAPTESDKPCAEKGLACETMCPALGEYCIAVYSLIEIVFLLVAVC